MTRVFACTVFYLVDIELALASGQFSVAGGELSDKVMAGRNRQKQLYIYIYISSDTE